LLASWLARSASPKRVATILCPGWGIGTSLNRAYLSYLSGWCFPLTGPDWSV
jgi:hypothetical protein